MRVLTTHGQSLLLKSGRRAGTCSARSFNQIDKSDLQALCLTLRTARLVTMLKTSRRCRQSLGQQTSLLTMAL